jgi:hypothetical protein
MQRLEIGGRGYVQGRATGSLSYTPLFDRAGRVTDIRMGLSDDPETIVVSVAGKEIMRVPQANVGGQNAFGNPSPVLAGGPLASALPHSLFTMLRRRWGIDMSFPVPNGLTFDMRALSGADMDYMIEFQEVDSGDINASQLNHPQSNEVLIPIFGFRAADISSTAPAAFDTQIAPPWVPQLFTGAEFPPGFTATIIAMFTEGVGVNTGDGTPDVLSNTSYIKVTRNGQQMFTRNGNGIPNVGLDAAAGSANTVFGQQFAAFPPISQWGFEEGGALDPPFVYHPGDTVLWEHVVAGDPTDGADYSGAVVVLIAKVTRP